MGIDAKLVKTLREKTGAGMMDCKKALVDSDGDINKAVDNLRNQEWLGRKGNSRYQRGSCLLLHSCREDWVF